MQDFGLDVRRLDTYSFVTQWKKEYLLKTDCYVESYDILGNYENEIQEKMAKEIIKEIKDISNYTRDVWEIYFKRTYETPFTHDIDPAGKFGMKPSKHKELTGISVEDNTSKDVNKKLAEFPDLDK